MISREQATQIAEAEALAHQLGERVDRVVLFDEITWREPCLPYFFSPAPDLPQCWIAYIEPSGRPSIRASTIVAVHRETGEVVYRGSAGDEG
ncbi:MAG: hypothetical protein JSS59_00005 [Proteobacteria bacterium]|nr:hypothetical protein [Pseudomonadota bacterium]